MEKKGWKITAILFIILFLSLLSIMVWGYNYAQQESTNEYLCRDKICYGEDFYDYYEGLCSCNSYSDTGELITRHDMMWNE